MKYEVWMKFMNYVGAPIDCEHIASFCSEARARHYVKVLEAENDDALIKYVIYTNGKAGKARI